MRVSICDKGKVADPLICLYIRDIGHPDLIGMRWDNVFDKVRILMKVMAGVCRLVSPSPAYLHHEPVLSEYLNKRIAAWHMPRRVKDLLDNAV